MAEANAIMGVHGVAQANDAEHKRRCQEGVENAVKGVPEAEDMVAGLVELENLVADEADGENVEEDLGGVELAGGVDRVDG